ncbi:ZKSC2 protein, partial [Drymodes brunneopygia]|nr:ZKSC2 protein [Drymodes brunneopygia]
ETFRWTVVQQIDAEKRRKAARPANFGNFESIVVLQKSYECGECGKNFTCGSHFAKHRRTHTG